MKDKAFSQFDHTQPAVQILWSVVDDMMLFYEEDMARLNNLDFFFWKLSRNTSGCLNEPPRIESELANLGINISLPEEESSLRPLLYFYTLEYKNYFRRYELFQGALEATPAFTNFLPSVESLKPKEADPETLIKLRMDALDTSMGRAFKKMEYELMPMILSAMWSLSESLKYMSRLYPAFQDKIYALINKFNERLEDFAQLFRSSIVATRIYPLNPPALHECGIFFREIIIVPISARPSGRKQPKIYFHVVPVRNENEELEQVDEVDLENPPTLSALVFVSQNTFSDRFLKKKFKEELLAYFHY